LRGIRVSGEPLTTGAAKFDLTVVLTELVGAGGEPLGIVGALDYSLDLFERETAQTIATRFVRLLEAATAAPDAPLHQLSILSADERRELLEGYNATRREVPDATLPELFEAQVARAPDAIAVVFGEESLSYAELNARANQLAHYLIGLGVGPEALVGIALERSVEMIVALLGVVKAGAAYLPLDPAYPKARLEYIVRDAAPATVLGSETDWQHVHTLMPVHNPGRSLRPAHPA
jgi:pristinamycin I synthase-3/4